MNKSKTAVVTGASRGIGRAIATHLARAGYDLAICCRSDREALEDTANTVRSLGQNCLTFMGDMGDSSCVSAFFDKIRHNTPDIDLLVNNVGMSYVGLLQDMHDEDWDRLLQTNLSSAFYCCREIIPSLLSRKSGKIIMISSVWGETGASMEAAYSATKAGINGLTKALAKELAPSGIQVNAVSCGYIDTGMNAHLSAEEQNALFAEIPVGRAASPDEVAEFVVQVATCGEYLTGQILRLDGGWI
ncbi:MAG: SDR family NAD(P)-dependent oxidoreductase [Lachnospiraceae bacterium]|nr:SDR family NAD(P)-dependent oxidoreductase [Lachnospiraceae bacterium]